MVFRSYCIGCDPPVMEREHWLQALAPLNEYTLEIMVENIRAAFPN